MQVRRAFLLLVGSVVVHLAVVACGGDDIGFGDRDAGAGEPEVVVEACNRTWEERPALRYAAHTFKGAAAEDLAADLVAIGTLPPGLEGGDVPFHADYLQTTVPFWISNDTVAAPCSGGFESITFIRR